ncbi:hypothetical protein BGZ61DRAFT_125524 [Ilyonectria robusta]|uniref:uncharacterized protein n=1 Tax=Ilyonectria robusta TaxID=1079257 RepID=UPI001E8E74A4|nr:uncharacterized protein BGZ61DRAFT_125524 [Ilyonectria robusta]KAH8734530.1 hypothetical protein BGZ61DRAFT_125524 [Ilyonectria robusta]
MSTNLHGTIVAGTRKQTATPAAFWHSRRRQWPLTRRHRGLVVGGETQQRGWKQDFGVEKQAGKPCADAKKPRLIGQYGRCDLAPSLAKSTTRPTAQQDRGEAPRRRGRDATGSRLSIDGRGLWNETRKSTVHCKDREARLPPLRARLNVPVPT